MHPRRLVLLAVAMVVAVTACSYNERPKPALTPPALPPGELSGLVLQPRDLPIALVPLLAQTGPRDIRQIAAYAADAAAEEQKLRTHNFSSAYAVQYGDPATGRLVVNVVIRFATASDAAADFAADLDAAKKIGTTLAVSGLGDEAIATSGKLDASANPDTLYTLRFRLDNTTWLLAVGTHNQVDQAEARQLAELLLTRARAPSSSPS